MYCLFGSQPHKIASKQTSSIVTLVVYFKWRNAMGCDSVCLSQNQFIQCQLWNSGKKGMTVMLLDAISTF